MGFSSMAAELPRLQLLLVALGFLLLGLAAGGQRMPKLANKKMCAGEECSHPISIATALEDYIAPDCRFITVHRGQTLYVFSKLKGRGRLFWAGSVQGEYYGEQAARIGFFPSSIVREEQYLRQETIDVPTDEWDFYCQ